MKEITREMIQVFQINKLGYDQMGYEFKNTNQLSFHHLIVSHADCKRLHIPFEGYIFENGAILRQDTSHDYLHLIERHDQDRFIAITCELIDENVQREILYKNLCYINDVLDSFEREYCSTRDSNNKLIIKNDYTRRKIK